MNRMLLLFFFVLTSLMVVNGQRSIIYDENVQTLMLVSPQGQRVVPVIRQGTEDKIEVSFDDLMHNYRRFTYRIEHVGSDFITDEGLFDSEFMVCEDTEIVVENYEQSLNTSVLYNHYSFTLPNASMRPLLSGNYRLVVSVEDEDGEPQKAFVAYFAVAEQVVGVSMTAQTNTDIDYNLAHQQLSLEVDYSSLSVRDADKELLTQVVQNSQWDRPVRLLRSNMNTGRSLKWEHCKDLIFPAGNEYRKFEQYSTRYPGMHVENVRYFEPYYYTTLMTDGVRRNYLFDEDQNGKFVPRCDRGGNPLTEADYTWTLFSLAMDSLPDTQIFVHGIWTGGIFDHKYQMHYNHQSGNYEALLLLKQGYYSYRYLSVKDGIGYTSVTEGNFHETENEYEVFVYYRPPGERYDRLVAWRFASYRPVGK